MKAADKYAALRALEAGLKAAIDKAGERVKAVHAETGAKSFKTPFGTLTFAEYDPTLSYDYPAMLAWAKTHIPTEVVAEHTETIPEQVRPTLPKILDGRFTIVEDMVFDSVTGDAVEWAHIKPGYETLSAKLLPEVKREAGEQVIARTDDFADLMAQPRAIGGAA